MKELLLNAVIKNCDDEEAVQLQFEQFLKSLSQKNPQKTILNDIVPGSVFKAGPFDIIALEHFQDQTGCILKNYYDRKIQFDGSSNNWINSNIEYVLNTDFYYDLSKAVGRENIIEHIVDLRTDDGFIEYGRTKNYISMFTTDMHRKYRTLVGAGLDKWIWTLTPVSIAKYSCKLRCILGGSGVMGDAYFYDEGCARPYFVLNSNIVVSELEEYFL